MMEVTLHLSDALYERARRWAAVTQQDLDTALTDALDVVLFPIHTTPELDIPVLSLSDEEVLTESTRQMPPDRGRRMTELSAQRRESRLNEAEQQELMALAHLYQRLWLRQSEALAEAVRRGLISGMHS